MLEHCENNSRSYFLPPRTETIRSLSFFKMWTIHLRLPCQKFPFPSKTTIKYELGAIDNIKEGDLRVARFLEHLENHNLPKTVWISEDGTRCESKVGLSHYTYQ